MKFLKILNIYNAIIFLLGILGILLAKSWSKICVSDLLNSLFLFFRSLCEDSSDAKWKEAEEEKDNN